MDEDVEEKIVKTSIVILVLLLPLFFLARISIDGMFDNTFLAWGWDLKAGDMVFDIFSKIILVPIVVSGVVLFLAIIYRFCE